MKTTFYAASIFLLIFNVANAVPSNYNALSEKERKAQQEQSIRPPEHTRISYDLVQTGENNDHLAIKIDGKLKYIEKKGFYPKYLDSMVVDIDRNGLDDLIFEYWPGSQGLALGCGIALYLQQQNGDFKKLTLPAESFSPRDVFDIDGDGRFEIVTVQLVNYLDHNYWVYRCWQIKNYEIVNVDERFDFPRAIWFTFKPNQKLVDKETTQEIISNTQKTEPETMFIDHQREPVPTIIKGENATQIKRNMQALFVPCSIRERKRAEKALVEIVSTYKLPEKDSVALDCTWSSPLNFAAQPDRRVLVALSQGGTGAYISFWVLHESSNHITCFAFRGMARYSGSWQVINDLDTDGAPEIITKHFLGKYVGGDFDAVWPAIYRWDGKNYVRADENFSDYYTKHVVPEYQEILSQHSHWENHEDESVRQIYRKCKSVLNKALSISKRSKPKP